ncbi:MAG TPA: hypothetical protein PKM44_12245 [Turneriella sp.]|nr:hypothetical protein [Turneriella sp.]HNL11277.1 hypothetical protein [Turneriella sp.]HNM99882.1 hypothetical protein [Turneriella sp.]
MNAGWLKSARFDVSLIAGVALLAAAMATTTVVWPALFLPVLAVHTWLFGYEHLWATYTNLVVHPDDRTRYWRTIWLVPPVLLLLLYFTGRSYGMTTLLVVYFFGQFFHTVRQSWGLAQQYRHRAGSMQWDNPRLSELTLWSVPIWGFLNRCSERPDEFIFQEFWLPYVPRTIVIAAGIVCAILWTHWLVTRIIAYQRRELAWGHTLYMASHALVYLGGYIVINELCSGWLLVNVWHNVQYMLFVWLFNNRRFAAGIDEKARALSWLSQGGRLRIALYSAATIALALPIYYLLPVIGTSFDDLVKNTAVPTAMVVGFTLTFHHYVADGVIWKRKNNPQMTLLQNAQAVFH